MHIPKGGGGYAGYWSTRVPNLCYRMLTLEGNSVGIPMRRDSYPGRQGLGGGRTGVPWPRQYPGTRVL
eukprot:3280045-Rhodomonas_salina.4